MLFLDFAHEHIDAYKSKYTDAAGVYKGKGLNFLLGDVKDSQAALQVFNHIFNLSSLSFDFVSHSEFPMNLVEQYFGLKEDQSPVLIVQNANGLKFINSNVEADQIAPWLKDYVVSFYT